jgi:hypothetical protein
VKHLVISVRGRPSEKEPAKTNFDTWRAAQPALLGRVRIRHDGRAYNRFVFEKREALRLKRKRQRKPKKGTPPCAS